MFKVKIVSLFLFVLCVCDKFKEWEYELHVCVCFFMENIQDLFCVAASQTTFTFPTFRVRSSLGGEFSVVCCNLVLVLKFFVFSCVVLLTHYYSCVWVKSCFAWFFFGGKLVLFFKCTKAAACLFFNLSDIYNNSYFV